MVHIAAAIPANISSNITPSAPFFLSAQPIKDGFKISKKRKNKKEDSHPGHSSKDPRFK